MKNKIFKLNSIKHSFNRLEIRFPIKVKTRLIMMMKLPSNLYFKILIKLSTNIEI